MSRKIVVTAGRLYRTRGGWPARVIWVSERHRRAFAIHKPGTFDESIVITHVSSGAAIPDFAVNNPPVYDVGHPADIMDYWEEETLKVVPPPDEGVN